MPEATKILSVVDAQVPVGYIHFSMEGMWFIWILTHHDSKQHAKSVELLPWWLLSRV